MKIKKPLFLLATAAILTAVSCQKDPEIENLDTRNVKNKLSKATYAKASAKYGNSFADSVNNLLQDFSLTQVNQPIDKTNDIVEEFKDVASAREFLDNLSKSSIVDDGRNLPKSNGNTFELPTNLKVTKKATDPSKKKAGLWDPMDSPLQFQFYIPSRKFVFLNWSWTSPVGFIIQGYLKGSDPIRYLGMGVRFNKYEIGEFDVNLYGPHVFTTYTRSHAFFQHYPGGYSGIFAFGGTVSLVVMIKDLGTLYSIPVQGRIFAQLGPYPLMMGGGANGAYQYTQMQGYYVTR